MKPSIGRIVHYTSYGTPGGEYPSVCRAAIVAAVHEYQATAESAAEHRVDLVVLNPEGLFFNKGVRYSMDSPNVGGTWHWPEFEAEGEHTDE